MYQVPACGGGQGIKNEVINVQNDFQGHRIQNQLCDVYRIDLRDVLTFFVEKLTRQASK